MNKNPKTLKDISDLDIALSGLIPAIREEAIKHIKFLEDQDNVLRNLTNGGSTETSEREAYAIKYWIKHFFNITSEELK